MNDDRNFREYLKWVTNDLYQARQRVSEPEGRTTEPTAIVAMACRFPGGSSSPDEPRDPVMPGSDGITAISGDHGRDSDEIHDPEPGKPRRTYPRADGFP
jgi:mycoketide-CoA synthase